MVGDGPVHQWLGVTRVVTLVVSVAAIAPHVDHDVLVEPLAVLERQPGHAHARLRVIAVDVEDRRLHGLGDVAAVQRGAGELGCRREPDLVVDDQVDRAADAVSGDVAHRQRLGDDSLAGERRISVDEDRQHGVGPGRFSAVLHRPRHPDDDRADGLEVARVGGELEVDVGAARADVLARRPEVVLDVAGALHRVGIEIALELTEDGVVALAHDVGQHVEPAAVGHPQHTRLPTRRRRRR